MASTRDLSCYSQIEEKIKDNLANTKGTLKICLAILFIGLEKFKFESLTVEEIVTASEFAGISLTNIQVRNSLVRAGKRVKRNDSDHGSSYKIMTLGINEIKDIIGGGSLSVMYLEGDKPISARKEIKDIYKSLNGELIIIDPYFGSRTIEMLSFFNRDRKIRFLTSTMDNRNSQLSNLLPDFKKEYKNFQLRKYPNGKELHDRYLISDDYLLILGHGFKDVGNKESFIVCIKKSLMEESIDEMTKKFETRWIASIPQ